MDWQGLLTPSLTAAIGAILAGIMTGSFNLESKPCAEKPSGFGMKGKTSTWKFLSP